MCNVIHVDFWFCAARYVSLNNFDVNVLFLENKISYYYSEFRTKFKYQENLRAVKAKPVDMSDNRSPVITMENNIVNCFSGKIQGIYYLEDYVRQLCEF